MASPIVFSDLCHCLTALDVKLEGRAVRRPRVGETYGSRVYLEYPLFVIVAR